jgi:membrane protein
MARLRDLSPVFQRIGFIGLCKRVWQQCGEDNVYMWASALAYSWLFAIFPFFVFLLSLVPYMPADAKLWIHDNLEGILDKSLPTDAFNTVWGFLTYKGRLETLLNSRPAGFLSFGLLLTIWAASGGMAVTVRALDKCYDLETPRPFYRVRLLALLMTFIVALLMLVAIIALPIATTVRGMAENFLINMHVQVPGWAFPLFDLGRYLIALICMFLSLAIMYYFGPCIKHRFRFFTPGAVFCVVVWLLLGAVFRIYVDRIGKTGYERTYGPVGGVVILLLFFYLDALVLLIGAEINSEIDFIAYDVPPGHRDFRGTPWQQAKLPRKVPEGPKQQPLTST